MKNSEKMYEAISGIRDDIIESAEALGSRRKRRFAWIGYAAAACLVLGASMFGLSRLAKTPAETQEAALPTQQITAVPTEDARRIVTGENGGLNEFVPSTGQRYLLPDLEQAIRAPENDGCLFDVEVRIWNYAEVEAYVESEWAKVMDKQNDPAILHYNEEYDYWLDNIYEPTEADLKAQENGKGREAEYFAAYWAENYPQEEQDAYSAAMEAAKEARRAYDASTAPEALKPLRDAAAARLLTKLAEAGFDIGQEEKDGVIINYLHGLLTREQIEGFPVSDCGAFILWYGYNGAADE